MSNLLYSRLANELWMLTVSYLPIKNVIPRLPSVSKYFNDVIIWGPTSSALMWREMALDIPLFRMLFPLNFEPALTHACSRYAPLAHITTLLKGGARVDTVDCSSYRWTALQCASNVGSADVVQVLLNANADINAVDMIGQTSLMIASETGHVDVVRVLLNNGANPNRVCHVGLTAVEYARMSMAQYGQIYQTTEVVTMLESAMV